MYGQTDGRTNEENTENIHEWMMERRRSERRKEIYWETEVFIAQSARCLYDVKCHAIHLDITLAIYISIWRMRYCKYIVMASAMCTTPRSIVKT